MEALEAECGAVDSRVELPKGKSIRAHLINLGFTAIRPGYKEQAVWYVTRRKIARVTAINAATLYLRLPGR
jgi:hypothetical protein